MRGQFNCGSRRERRSIALAGAVAAGLLLGTGCATPNNSPRLSYTGDAVVDGRNAAEAGPEKDRVLWQYRTGVTAMRRGDFAEAERQLDAALLRVGGIISPDKSAKKARGMFS